MTDGWGDGIVTIRRASVTADCDACGRRLHYGSEYAHVRRRDPWALGWEPDRKWCGVCASIYLPAPSNWEDFYATQSEVDVPDILAIVDSGNCDSSCVLSLAGPNECECRCEGNYHGALRRLLERLFDPDDTPHS